MVSGQLAATLGQDTQNEEVYVMTRSVPVCYRIGYGRLRYLWRLVHHAGQALLHLLDVMVATEGSCPQLVLNDVRRLAEFDLSLQCLVDPQLDLGGLLQYMRSFQSGKVWCPHIMRLYYAERDHLLEGCKVMAGVPLHGIRADGAAQ
eukprot:90929-Karenia_brevis.AAC.1